MKQDVRVFPDSDKLAMAAADFFAGAAAGAILKRERCSAALSGGATPRQLLSILSLSYSHAIRWDCVHLFWADERSVSPEDAQSNYRLAYDELISKISIPARNIHRIRGELAPAEAAREYEEVLRRHFSGYGLPEFDIILLGVGPDGHTASLFPGSEALLEKTRYAVPSYSETAGNWRVTLTMPVLNNALDILFLVSGSSKAVITSEILYKGNGNLYPAGLVDRIKGNTTWLLDSEAASELPL